MVKVETSVGTIEVGRLTWGGYVRLKNTLRAALQGPVASVLRDIVQYVDNALGEKFTLDQLPAMADALIEVDRLVSEAAPELISACVRGEMPQLEVLEAADVLKLRNAVLEANPLDELLVAEKNWYGGVLATIQQSLPAAPAPRTSGTSVSNTPSPTGTAGA